MYILYYWSGIWRGSPTLRGAGVPLLGRPFSVYSFLVYCYSLLFMSFLLISYTRLLFYSFTLMLSLCKIFICHIAVILIYLVDFIACSGCFRLSVYMWGILPEYIRRWLSSRLRFHVFEKQGVTVSVDLRPRWLLTSWLSRRDILQQTDHRLISQFGKNHSERYPCRATGLNYTKPLIFEDLAS